MQKGKYTYQRFNYDRKRHHWSISQNNMSGPTIHNKLLNYNQWNALRKVTLHSFETSTGREVTFSTVNYILPVVEAWNDYKRIWLGSVWGNAMERRRVKRTYRFDSDEPWYDSGEED